MLFSLAEFAASSTRIYFPSILSTAFMSHQLNHQYCLSGSAVFFPVGWSDEKSNGNVGAEDECGFPVDEGQRLLHAVDVE